MKFQTRGFGLIELLISILIGLIVVAGITSMVVATLRANTENLEMTRLTQEMRSVMQLTVRDLRRAGYAQNAIRDFGSGNQDSNAFTQIQVFDSNGNEVTLTDTGIPEDNPAPCVLFSYDSNSDGALQDEELRGFRFDTDANAIEVKVKETGGNTCNDSDEEWEQLTDPAFVRVDQFGISTVDGEPVPVLTDPDDNPILTVRQLIITMDAGLINDEGVQRDMRETVRVRTDLLN